MVPKHTPSVYIQKKKLKGNVDRNDDEDEPTTASRSHRHRETSAPRIKTIKKPTEKTREVKDVMYVSLATGLFFFSFAKWNVWKCNNFFLMSKQVYLRR